jgi:DNA polymerase-3 subunit alpha (Gram-positive type)
MMSFRIAYCKVHHPLAFYSTFFSIKVDDFDAELVCRGKNYIRSKMKEMEDSVVPLSKKEQDLYTILEVVDEMYSRGFEFHKVNLYESDSDNFIIKDGKLLPPLRALQGVGENAARNLVDVRDDEEFLSKEDIQKRAKVTKTVIEALDTHGCLKGLPDSNQLSLFQFA